jgi:hypothetical protein
MAMDICTLGWPLSQPHEAKIEKIPGGRHFSWNGWPRSCHGQPPWMASFQGGRTTTCPHGLRPWDEILILFFFLNFTLKLCFYGNEKLNLDFRENKKIIYFKIFQLIAEVSTIEQVSS